jgi:hypothetical protein
MPEISNIKIMNNGEENEVMMEPTQGDIPGIVTKLVLGGASKTDHMMVLDSR